MAIPPHGRTINRSGFTLLEVILVLLLISIFATIAVSRQPSTDVTLKAQANALKSHIYYAQMRAMNTDTIWGIGYTSNSYWLFKQAHDNQHLLPGEGQLSVDLDAKGISLNAEGSNRLSFDTWGRSYSDDTLLSNDSLFIQISKDGQSETLIIMPETGFIQ